MAKGRISYEEDWEVSRDAGEGGIKKTEVKGVIINGNTCNKKDQVKELWIKTLGDTQLF